MATQCPECDSELDLDGYDLDVGETLNCPECSCDLKVTGVAPIDVRAADAAE